MALKFDEVTESVLLGEPLRSVASRYRDVLLVEMGFDLDDAPRDLFQKETDRFMSGLCRHLGDRHSGDARVAAALEDWVRMNDDYDAFDTLLCHYRFESREAVLARGRILFPGPLTAHWGEEPGL